VTSRYGRSEVASPRSRPNAEAEQATVPMFRPPSAYTPGETEPCYSPHQFLALTQVGTDPEDDPALWLTEERVDVVHKEGILLLKQYFYDSKLDRYVTGKTKPHKRPNLVVRYNRALLARHVLDEVIVYLQEPNGCYREICRPRVREKALAEVDVNLAVSYQDKYRRVLAQKRKKAQEAYLNQESGAEAVARLREQSQARAERQKRSRPEPIAAAPMEHARDPVDPGLQRMVDEATDQHHERSAPQESEPATSSGSKKGSKRRRGSREGSAKSKGLSEGPKARHGGSKSGRTGPTVEGLLGGATGFANDRDED
jgi:hypothetical protein